MAKLRVYLETSFVSYLTGAATPNVQIAMAQAYTRRWWEEERGACELFVSKYTIIESERGIPSQIVKRLDVVRGVSRIDPDETAVVELAQKLIAVHALPPGEATDALHIASAAVAGMDVLLTWNCKHIANAVTLPRTMAVIREAGYACPLIMTPRTFFEYKELEA